MESAPRTDQLRSQLLSMRLSKSSVGGMASHCCVVLNVYSRLQVPSSLMTVSMRQSLLLHDAKSTMSSIVRSPLLFVSIKLLS